MLLDCWLYLLQTQTICKKYIRKWQAKQNPYNMEIHPTWLTPGAPSEYKLVWQIAGKFLQMGLLKLRMGVLRLSIQFYVGKNGRNRTTALDFYKRPYLLWNLNSIVWTNFSFVFIILQHWIPTNPTTQFDGEVNPLSHCNFWFVLSLLVPSITSFFSNVVSSQNLCL